MTPPSIDLRDLVGRVADNLLTLDPGDDYWERQGAMTAFLGWEHPAGAEAAERWLDRAVSTQTSAGWLCHGATTALRYGDFAIGQAPLMKTFVRSASCAAYYTAPLALAYRRTRDERLRTAALAQIEAFLAGPRTSEGFLLMNESAIEVWIDEVYPICGALAVWGTSEGLPEWVDEAYRHLEICFRRLIDPATGLARHVWRERPDTFPESTFWSRGNGWLVDAAVEVLAEAPDHPQAPTVTESLTSLLTAISTQQDRTGLLHDTLDDTDSPLESTGTLMYAYAVGRAARLDLVADDVLQSGIRALDGVAAVTTTDGVITRAMLPPGGPGVPLGTMPLAQSLFLLAAHWLGPHVGVPDTWES